jgi:uroporphyrinogen-III synthase
MPINKIEILSTKVINKRLISLANTYNIFIDEVPFLETKNIETPDVKKRIEELSKQSITAIFTSVNAVNAVKEILPTKPQWKVFCIGHKTKSAVEAAFGDKNILGSANNAEQLAEEIIKHPTKKKMIFFCGNQRRNVLPDKLKENEIELEELIVYRTVETPQHISKHYDGILFYSPSGVRSFFAKNTIEKSMQLFAIGTTTANEAKVFTGLPVITTEHPDTTNLINLVIQHFTTIKSSECSN